MNTISNHVTAIQLFYRPASTSSSGETSNGKGMVVWAACHFYCCPLQTVNIGVLSQAYREINGPGHKHHSLDFHSMHRGIWRKPVISALHRHDLTPLKPPGYRLPSGLAIDWLISGQSITSKDRRSRLESHRAELRWFIVGNIEICDMWKKPICFFVPRQGDIY